MDVAASPPRTSGRVRYLQAVNVLSKDLRERKYTVGNKLPSLRELSAAMKLNHRTVRRGVEELVRDGMLEVRPGVGVFVADRAPRIAASHGKKSARIALGCRSYMFSGDKHHPIISAYLVGAHRKFTSPDVSVQTMVYHEHKLAEDLGQAIETQGIDGFVVCSGGLSQQDFEFFEHRRIPLVHCAHMPADHPWPVSIAIDLGATLRQGMDHLRQLGHRRIAFAAYTKSADNGAIHRQFDRMVFDYEMGDVRQLHLSLSDDQQEQWASLESFFDIHPMPTAVIVHDEFIADVLLAGCRRRGIRVPGDLSIVCLQDAAPFSHSVPLTAPDWPKVCSDMIYTACDSLERLLRGESIPQRQIRITPELITKASTASSHDVSLPPIRTALEVS